MLHVAYLSIDEVNLSTARELVEERNAAFNAPSFSEPLPYLDAVVYDLDCLPPDLREQIVAQLRSGRPSFPTAVHSYGLADELARDLRSNGVLVARKLTPGLLARLLRLAGMCEPTTVGKSLSYKTPHHPNRPRKERLP